MTTLDGLESKIISNPVMIMTGISVRVLEHEVNKRNINDKSSNIFQAIATQRENRDKSN